MKNYVAKLLQLMNKDDKHEKEDSTKDNNTGNDPHDASTANWPTPSDEDSKQTAEDYIGNPGSE